jgi:hypothetical protein
MTATEWKGPQGMFAEPLTGQALSAPAPAAAVGEGRRNVWDPPKKPGDLLDCIYRPSPRTTWILLDKLDSTRLPLAVIERVKYL